jgi:hypothetical protein
MRLSVLFGGPSSCAGKFVVDGAEHAVGGMASVVVLVVDPSRDRVACLLTGGEVVATQQLPFHTNSPATGMPASRTPKINPTCNRVRLSTPGIPMPIAAAKLLRPNETAMSSSAIIGPVWRAGHRGERAAAEERPETRNRVNHRRSPPGSSPELTNGTRASHDQHTARGRASPVPCSRQSGGPITLASDNSMKGSPSRALRHYESARPSVLGR